MKLSRSNEAIQIVGLDDPEFTERDPSLQQSMQETKLQRMHLSKEYRISLSYCPENYDIYVSSVIGNSIIPIRIDNPPEIVCAQLKQK